MNAANNRPSGATPSPGAPSAGATRSVRYASEFDHSGYAVAATRCIDALITAGVDVTWEPLVNRPGGRVRTSVAPDAPRHLRARRRLARPGDHVVVHSVPMAWAQLRRELAPRHLVGHTVWEGERLPQRWLTEMDCVDEFWVPTAWNRDVFADAFGRPVHVVPHVADPGLAGALPIDLPDDVFVVAAVAAWDWRKRPDRTIEAFLDAFTADDDVVLVVKTTARPIAWFPPLRPPVEEIARLVAARHRPPRVVVDTDDWDDPSLRALYERADVFLSLTHGEGWGLGAFDAACRDTPVVATGWGGQVEWMGADYPGLLPYSLVPATHPDTTLFDPSMTWAWADHDAAVDLLRALHRGHAGELVDHAHRLGAELRAHYAPERVGADTAGLVAPATSTAAASSRSGPLPPPADAPPPRVLVLTPVKNAARHADGWADRVLSLGHPPDRLSVGVLVSDSDDGSVQAFTSALERLASHGVATTLLTEDFGYVIPPGVERWEPSIQLDRRLVLARSRNRLLFGALRNEDWVLWLDADVVAFPPDILATLLGVGADVVHPDCVRTPGGPSFDTNAWTDRGRWHLDDYRGCGEVELHAVGATMLLVRADCHRDGLVWPSWRHGIGSDRARSDPASIGRPELGEVESEGLGILAADLGISCIGLPDVAVVHE